MTARVYPHSIEAERALLGQCILDEEVLTDVGRLVSPEDFYRSDHARLFALLQDMASRGPVDSVLLMERLLKEGEIERFGGLTYVLELPDHAPTTANARHYAEVIREHSQRREAIEALEEACEAAHDRAAPVADLVDDAVARVSSVGEKHRRDDEGWVCDVIDDIDAESANAAEEGHDALPIPRDRVSELIDVQPGKMIVIMGLTGHGKTSFALDWLTHFSDVDVQIPAGIVSLEMHRKELLRRQLAGLSGVPAYKHRKGWMTPADWTAWNAAAERIADAPVRYIDRSGLTIDDVRARAYRLHRQLQRLGWPGLRCLFIDYLQRLRPTDPRMPRSQAVAEMSAGCKDIAQELQIPVVVLAQPNRMSLGEVDKRPKLHHLKDSGSIEQDADIVLGVYYHARTMSDAEAKKDHWPNYYEVEVLKNRGGGLGRAILHFTPELTRFRDLTVEEFRSWEGPEQAARTAREEKRAASSAGRI